MKVLLISTYELGHQPLHLAAPAGAALGGGHQVRCLDLAVEEFGMRARADISWAEAVAISVPMHTAMRLALPVCRLLRAEHPDLPICLYGLYSPLAAEPGLAHLVDQVIAGEYIDGLLEWLEQLQEGRRSPARSGLDHSDLEPSDLKPSDLDRSGVDRSGDPGGPGVRVELRRSADSALPARHLLPPLSAYARLLHQGQAHLAGYVEATHGCAHRCRHCPVPVVYDGRFRLVPTDGLLADVDQLVAEGASHITFGDPDFLNGPQHARRVVAAVHSSFPELTFDCTAKVSHILDHADIWPELAAAGCLFVVSAFESTDDHILARLDKGHSGADCHEAVATLRRAGITPRPTWMAFTPWTRTEHLADLVDFVAAEDLVESVDTVQFGLRLLVPPGSLLLGLTELAGLWERYDPEALTWLWRSPYEGVDDLQAQLAALAEASQELESPSQAWEQLCSLVSRANRGRRVGIWSPTPGAPPAPGLSESWFCCAEPTQSQRLFLPVAAEP